MVRPASTPRLRDLQPEAVAGEVVRLVREHLRRLAFCLVPGVAWKEVGNEPERSDLAWRVLHLVQFAQTGGLADWEDESLVVDALQEVCSALYSRAGEPGTFGVGAMEEAVGGAELDAIGLVLVGAFARYKLPRRALRVTSRELGVLAGVDPDHVRLLARQGELELKDGTVGRAEARRWLVARGVRDFAASRY